MCLFLMGKPSLDDEAEDEATEEATGSKEDDDDDVDPAVNNPNPGSAIRPSEWFFTGWFAFKLFGPTCLPQHRIVLLQNGDLKPLTSSASKKDFGRSSARDGQAKQKAIERVNGVHGARGTPGLTVDQQIAVENLAVRCQSHGQNKKEGSMIKLSLESTSLDAAIKRATDKAVIICPTYDATHWAWVKVEELEVTWSEIQLRMSGCMDSPEKSPGSNKHGGFLQSLEAQLPVEGPVAKRHRSSHGVATPPRPSNAANVESSSTSSSDEVMVVATTSRVAATSSVTANSTLQHSSSEGGDN
jgi:hypothetical protein